MRSNNVLGIIFSNLHEDLIRELTAVRTTASVPFGGRYRMIDFPLSNMVNSGISKVGVITKHNYQSLMDHLGSGKSWNLSRRRSGLYILPPFSNNDSEFSSRIETLLAIESFLRRSKEEYVLLTDCHTVCNIDYQDVLSKHIKNNADITVVYKKGIAPEKLFKQAIYEVGSNGKVKTMLIDPHITSECNYGIDMTLIRKDLLMELLYECKSKNSLDFKRDIIQSNVSRFNIFGYELKGFSATITSISSYFEANMALMNSNVRKELFNIQNPIYTKVRDDMPTIYGLGSLCKNSLIANGCVIEGEVENSIIFRGVHIGKGSKISNCVIMQDTNIGENSNLSYVISDKDVVIKNERSLMGYSSYPVYISKASVV